MAGYTNGGRSQAYQDLRESEELHRATLSSISDAVFMTDDDGAFTYVCPNVDVIFGYVPDEVRAMSRINALLGNNLFDANALTTAGEIRNVEREVRSKDGERRTVLIHLKRVAIKGGTILYTCRDVTELKRAERDLLEARMDLAHAGRLALAGQLMTSIVHEVQQPMTAIHANAQAGLRILGEETNDTGPDHKGRETLREVLADIRDQTDTVSHIVERLRALARRRALNLQALSVNDVAAEILELAHADARRRSVALRTALAEDLPSVLADRVSLQQVILNLVVNAMDAMDETDGERLVTLGTRVEGDAIQIWVKDTGRGVSMTDRERLFDAFFTTKPDGIGLGLAIARSIAEAHGGTIWAEANDGPGATFRLALPLASDDQKRA